jgi:signal transduction histidine kinase
MTRDDYHRSMADASPVPTSIPSPPADSLANGAAGDELTRLHALHGYRVLDTPAEARFDRITLLLARCLNVPIALISLVDAQRQWFKSRQGLEATSTARDVAFCAHAIHGAELFVVEDALEDTRFADNPLVQGAPHIRFYAGAPLITPQGQRLGTLCAIDQKPRRLSEEQRSLLRELADHVMDVFELRRLAVLERDAEEISHALSHDLRPGLHQMKTFGELIASEPDNRLTQRSARHLSLIGEICERTRVRLDAIREFLRMGEDGELAALPLDALLAKVLERHAQLAGARKAEIEIGALPAVLGQRSQLELLFGHLLDNALKYGPLGVRISVRGEQREGRVWLEILDNGGGIPEAQRERALRLFQRLHGTEVPGQGAGLALCRKLVELSGGSLLLETAPGGGTAVRFSLPAA